MSDVWRNKRQACWYHGGGSLVSLPEALDPKALEAVFAKTIEAVDRGREDIYNISEAARAEYMRIKTLVSEIRSDLELTIKEVDEVEYLFQRARIKLMQVSKDFTNYSEREISEVYDTAHSLQLRLSTARERERELKKSRDELERTMKKLQSMVERSESMVSNMSIASEILRGNLEVASKAFADMNQRYQFGVRVIVAQEEERKRVARELHDGPVQALANVALCADYCQKIHEAGKTEIEINNELSQIKKLVQDILVEMRHIIFNLRPMSLDDLGLIPALSRFIDNMKKSTKVKLELIQIGHEVRLAAPMEIALFRMAQEAINNALKHSRCKEIVLKVEFTETEVVMQIKDNGFGFDLEEAKAYAAERQSYGLLGMEERIRLLGGKFGIETDIGQGTKVWARVAYDNTGGEPFGRKN